jgi:hypothetical protein
LVFVFSRATLGRGNEVRVFKYDCQLANLRKWRG